MYEKLLLWLLIGGILFCLWVISRQRFNQVLLVGGLAFASGLIMRLVRLSGDLQSLLTVFYFLLGIAALYGVVWLGARYFEGHR